MSSKVKIKAIQIKNFKQIFKVNKEKSNGSYLKTSERSKIIGTNNKKIINKKLMLQKYNKIANNNIISYTEREKAKRFSLDYRRFIWFLNSCSRGYLC